MAMTMPVEMVDGVMSFVLPKADADAPPAPTDDKVTIGERPARTVALRSRRGDAGRDRAPALEVGGRLEGGGPGSRGRLVHGAPVQLAVHDPLAAPERARVVVEAAWSGRRRPTNCRATKAASRPRSPGTFRLDLRRVAHAGGVPR